MSKVVEKIIKGKKDNDLTKVKQEESIKVETKVEVATEPLKVEVKEPLKVDDDNAKAAEEINQIFNNKDRHKYKPPELTEKRHDELIKLHHDLKKNGNPHGLLKATELFAEKGLSFDNEMKQLGNNKDDDSTEILTRKSNLYTIWLKTRDKNIPLKKELTKGYDFLELDGSGSLIILFLAVLWCALKVGEGEISESLQTLLTRIFIVGIILYVILIIFFEKKYDGDKIGKMIDAAKTISGVVILSYGFLSWYGT